MKFLTKVGTSKTMDVIDNFCEIFETKLKRNDFVKALCPYRFIVESWC